MHVHSRLTCKEGSYHDKFIVIVVISACLFFVTGLGIVFYSGDLSDIIDHPVIALVSPIVSCHPHTQISFFTLISDALNVFSLRNNQPIVIRAPPLQTSKQ